MGRRRFGLGPERRLFLQTAFSAIKETTRDDTSPAGLSGNERPAGDRRGGGTHMAMIQHQSAAELVGQIKAGRITPVELMEETLKRIDAINPALNAFVSLYPERAMDEAKAITARLHAGEDCGPLSGLPIGVKDMEDVAGMVTSFGSIPFEDNIVPLDSVQVARLRKAGAIVVGKTNTPEFAFTGFTKNRLFGTTRNPWNRERTPGGSSGGSASAVAGGMVAMATGSDGGGSIRIPASYSGCFGLKTSYGRIPWGPLPYLYMHQIPVLGPLTRTVEDAALYLDCVAGYHPADPTSLPKPSESYLQRLRNLPKGLRIAFSPTLGYARVQSDVMSRVEAAVQSFVEMGHEVELWDGVLPDVGDAWSAMFNCDIFAQLEGDLEAYRADIGKAIVSALDQVKSLSVLDIIAAQRVRTEVNRIVWELFDRFDLLLTPTMPTEAFAAAGPPPSEIDGRPIPLLGAVAFTYPFNFTGHPACSVRAGLSDSGLPVGLQIVGPRHRDDLVLQAAFAFEQARPWNDQWPEVIG
jgi:Asp-tRNA(Asn)/Glu-tRNA(Gln) amidotransferase A subunit family amidase